MVVKISALQQVGHANFVESVLRRIAADIEPTRTQKIGAQRSHNHLRALLNSGQMGSRILGSYLSGSYARDTAIRPLDDVDVIFEIDPSYWNTDLLRTLPTPERVLQSFATAIRRRYALSSVHGQRRSVRLNLNHLDIDVVPAIPDRSDPNLILVPDRRSDEWIKSSPLRHSQIASRVNAKSDGRFKPLVKLAKFWNHNLPDTTRCKSFTIETLATRIFQSKSFTSLGEGLVLFWDFLAARFDEPTIAVWPQSFGTSFNWLSISVPDTAGTGSNTAAYMTHAQARLLAAKARISRDKLLAACNARGDDTCENHILSALRA
jgi:hypothetical protein